MEFSFFFFFYLQSNILTPLITIIRWCYYSSSFIISKCLMMWPYRWWWHLKKKFSLSWLTIYMIKKGINSIIEKCFTDWRNIIFMLLKEIILYFIILKTTHVYYKDRLPMHVYEYTQFFWKYLKHFRFTNVALHKHHISFNNIFNNFTIFNDII